MFNHWKLGGSLPENQWYSRLGILSRKKNKKQNILFEPSDKWPSALRGTTSLGRGEKIYVRIENVSEEEQILNLDWDIGTMEVLEGEPDFPWTEAEEEGLPLSPMS